MAYAFIGEAAFDKNFNRPYCLITSAWIPAFAEMTAGLYARPARLPSRLFSPSPLSALGIDHQIGSAPIDKRLCMLRIAFYWKPGDFLAGRGHRPQQS